MSMNFSSSFNRSTLDASKAENFGSAFQSAYCASSASEEGKSNTVATSGLHSTVMCKFDHVESPTNVLTRTIERTVVLIEKGEDSFSCFSDHRLVLGDIFPNQAMDEIIVSNSAVPVFDTDNSYLMMLASYLYEMDSSVTLQVAEIHNDCVYDLLGDVMIPMDWPSLKGASTAAFDTENHFAFLVSKALASVHIRCGHIRSHLVFAFNAMGVTHHVFVFATPFDLTNVQAKVYPSAFISEQKSITRGVDVFIDIVSSIKDKKQPLIAWRTSRLTRAFKAYLSAWYGTWVCDMNGDARGTDRMLELFSLIRCIDEPLKRLKGTTEEDLHISNMKDLERSHRFHMLKKSDGDLTLSNLGTTTMMHDLDLGNLTQTMASAIEKERKESTLLKSQLESTQKRLTQIQVTSENARLDEITSLKQQLNAERNKNQALKQRMDKMQMELDEQKRMRVGYEHKVEDTIEEHEKRISLLRKITDGQRVEYEKKIGILLEEQDTLNQTIQDQNKRFSGLLETVRTLKMELSTSSATLSEEDHQTLLDLQDLFIQQAEDINGLHSEVLHVTEQWNGAQNEQATIVVRFFNFVFNIIQKLFMSMSALQGPMLHKFSEVESELNHIFRDMERVDTLLSNELRNVIPENARSDLFTVQESLVTFIKLLLHIFEVLID
ncbi:hypothetical protein PCE1_003703 [Barthelona sp. PCE]